MMGEGSIHSFVKVLWELELEDVVVKLKVHVVFLKLRLHVRTESKHEWFKKPRWYIHCVDYIRFEMSCIVIIHHGFEEGGVVQHHLRVESNMETRQMTEVS